MRNPAQCLHLVQSLAAYFSQSLDFPCQVRNHHRVVFDLILVPGDKSLMLRAQHEHPHRFTHEITKKWPIIHSSVDAKRAERGA